LFMKKIKFMDEVTDNMKKEMEKDKVNANARSNANENTKSNTNSNTNQEEKNLPKEQNMSFAQYCYSKSIPLMAAAPLSMGLLTNINSSPPSWHPAPKVLKDACANASSIAHSYNVDLPTLSILFALCHGSISCTLLGMKSVEEVDVALAVVRRIGNVAVPEQVPLPELVRIKGDTLSSSSNSSGISSISSISSTCDDIQSVLNDVLTNDEKTVLHLLLDKTNGPFAKVWSSGEYEWDGIKEAEDFWSTCSNNVSASTIASSTSTRSDEAKREAFDKMRRKS
jgi:hypothetical protein